MLELLQFIFSSFWIFSGFVVLLILFIGCIEELLVNTVKAVALFKKKNKGGD